MKKIRKVGRIQPRGSVDFYKENPDLFHELNIGGIIEVPDDVFPLLKGVIETSEESSNFTTSSTKPKDKKSSKTKTQNLAYLEANLSKKEREKRDGEDMGLNDSSKLSNTYEEPEEGDIVIKHEDNIKTEDKVED